MKFSKSWILTLSWMLLANSFLLLATAYATENTKQIKKDPANAKQNIQEIILSNWSEKNICAMILFDKSWSMFDEKQSDGTVTRLNKPGTKWNNAVSWTIEYSELLLQQYPTAKIWLVLFGDSAKITKKLGNDPFKIEDFPVPTRNNENTRLDLWIKQGIVELSSKPECTIKNIIIISDWEPTWVANAAQRAFEKTLEGKKKWINFYSIWYQVGRFGKEVLWWVSAWWFYEAEHTNIATILKNMAQENGSSMEAQNGKLKINTKNFIITMSWNSHNNDISANSKFSNILWWKWNRISAWSSMSCIIAWNTNSIQSSDWSTILWWNGNQINQWNPTANSIWGRSTIIWWYKNAIELWSLSTIWWWSGNNIDWSNYSTIIWNNSKIIWWDTSVAMGSNTKNYWKNSFYRTDWNNRAQLTQDNVFAIVSEKWMAVNTNNPHEAAKLTISWNLSITPNDNDENIVCWDWTWKWIIKAVNKNNNNDECLCSCNWTKRESLYNWACEWICNNEIVPACWDTVSFNPTNKTYQGSCSSSTPIDTSYFVTKENIIHRACQTHDGNIANCTWTL